MNEAMPHRWKLEESLAWEERRLAERDPSGRLAPPSGLDELERQSALPAINATLHMKEIHEELGFEPETETP
jgi:hypothetical protein